MVIANDADGFAARHGSEFIVRERASCQVQLANLDHVVLTQVFGRAHSRSSCEARSGGLVVKWNACWSTPARDRFDEFTEATDSVSPVIYPRLVEVTGRCPPEDCGGPWGYAELLDAIKYPKYERHAELTEWIGVDFDPDAVDPEWLTADVTSLAKKWSRKPTAKRARRAPALQRFHQCWRQGSSSVSRVTAAG